jgi:hypothetical protein
MEESAEEGRGSPLVSPDSPGPLSDSPGPLSDVPEPPDDTRSRQTALRREEEEDQRVRDVGEVMAHLDDGTP